MANILILTYCDLYFYTYFIQLYLFYSGNRVDQMDESIIRCGLDSRRSSSYPTILLRNQRGYRRQPYWNAQFCTTYPTCSTCSNSPQNSLYLWSIDIAKGQQSIDDLPRGKVNFQPVCSPKNRKFSSPFSHSVSITLKSKVGLFSKPPASFSKASTKQV